MESGTRILAASLSIAVVLGSSSRAAAYCNIPQPRLICAEYFASQVVVEATLTQDRAIHYKEDPDGIAANVYTMNADEVLRGTISSTFEVFDPNDSGRATFDLVRGKKYTLFLFYSPLVKSWEFDSCGNSGLLTGSNPVRPAIEALRHAHGPGVIQGLVSRQELDKPVAGVHVEAKGATGVYRAVTSETGAFRIQVPPGDYSVAAIDNRWLFSKADISYENPQKAQIQSGGCVQIQFVQSGTRESPH